MLNIQANAPAENLLARFEAPKKVAVNGIETASACAAYASVSRRP